MPYHDANLDIPNTTLVWPLNGDVTLNWTSPADTSGYILIWRGHENPDWTNSAILARLAATETTYTDTPSPDGTAWFYWAIAYSADNQFSGYNYGSVGCQNSSVIGPFNMENTNDGAHNCLGPTGDGYNAWMAFSQWAGAASRPGDPGIILATVQFTWGAFTPGNPATWQSPTFEPPFPTIASFIDTVVQNVGHTRQLVLADTTPQDVTSPNTVTDSETHVNGWSDDPPHNYVYDPPFIHKVGTNGFPAWGGYQDPPGLPGEFLASCHNIFSLARVSFEGPAGTLVQGAGSPGGSNANPPSAGVGLPLILAMPTPTPLPCIPCCRTEAPCADGLGNLI